MEESNVQPVRCPVTVCGDIHGQFVRLVFFLHFRIDNPLTFALDYNLV